MLIKQPIIETTQESTQGTTQPLPKEKQKNSLKEPLEYAQDFIDFISDNPTVYHAIADVVARLIKDGYQKLTERDLSWKLKAGGKYFVTRNGTALIAFIVGDDYKAGNGVAMIAAHIDALTLKLKPNSTKPVTEGYERIAVAPYAGALNTTWLDRDLGLGGRVIHRAKTSAGIEVKQSLVKLPYPIGRIPSLAPHFGAIANPPYDKESQMVPIIGLLNGGKAKAEESQQSKSIFTSQHSPRLVKAVTKELGIDAEDIIDWDLEMFDTQRAQLGGLDGELLFAARVDDKICSYAAIEGLLANSSANSGQVKLVALFDDEEIGSRLRQGAMGNFLPTVVERIVDSKIGPASLSTVSWIDLIQQTYANSFLVSSDVTHAVNPNFLHAYLENHMPQLNVGIGVACDSNGHMTTDAISTSVFKLIAEENDCKLQYFQIRNGQPSGGTVGPMLSSRMGVRAIDAGIPQLSMHSIRATVGSLDPYLGVKIFGAFLKDFERVDKAFAKID